MKISCLGAECNGDVMRELIERPSHLILKNSILEYPMAPEEKKILCHLDISWRPVCGADG